MLTHTEFSLEKFTAFTFCLLGCSLTETADALAKIGMEEAGHAHFHMTEGEFTPGEVFAIGNDGVATRKRLPHSQVAIMYSPPGSAATLIMSSAADGWITLSNTIAHRNSTFRYAFAMSDHDNSEAKNALEYRDDSVSPPVERVVYAMKDPRWVFFQEGKALWFEEVENYRKHKIKDRINKRLLVRYCEKLGLNISGPDFFHLPNRCLRYEYNWEPQQHN